MTQHATIPPPALPAHAAGHGPHAHQFDDASQQHEAVTLGMWAFLATEVMFFGGLFASYIVYRSLHGHAFLEAGHHLLIGPAPASWGHFGQQVFSWGAINTGVLLTSSLTMALGVRAAQLGRRRAVVGFLLVTMLLGLCFLAIKGIEYHHKWVDHLVPGTHFAYEGANWRSAQLFFIFYFVMTGLHALHMVAGVGVVAWMVEKAIRKPINEVYANPIEMAGLYWHFVDIVWVFLFPVLYLSH